MVQKVRRGQLTTEKFDKKYDFEPKFTRLDRTLVIFNIIIMGYLFLRHIVSDPAWGKYAGYMALFTIVGFFGSQALSRQKLMAVRKYKKDTILWVVVLLVASMLTQIIANVAFTFSTVEQALYYVFAAVSEEMFFRVFLLSVILRFNPPLSTKIIAIVLQAIVFAAFHQNYYHNFPMLLSVFIGGLIYGAFYVWKENPTANILAHFLLNLYAVQSLVFTL